MIDVIEYTKLYGDTVAVRSLSFRVAPGDVLGLVGPNGAGKTTTLRALAGILQPTSGSIRIADIDLHTDPVAAKSRLAFIPDEPQLFDYLTVTEHLQFVARLYGVHDAAPRIPVLLEELELTAKKDAPAHRTLTRHEAEARHCLRPVASAVGVAARRAAYRTRSGRHPAHERNDCGARP